MSLDTHEWERLFIEWHEAKATHVGFMQRAHLSAAVDSKRTAGLLMAASLAMADMHAAATSMRALMPLMPPTPRP